MLSDVGFDTMKELQEIAGIVASPASLPPLDVARQLVDFSEYTVNVCLLMMHTCLG